MILCATHIMHGNDNRIGKWKSARFLIPHPSQGSRELNQEMKVAPTCQLE